MEERPLSPRVENIEMTDAPPLGVQEQVPLYNLISFAPDSASDDAPKPIEDAAWEDELMYAILKNEKQILSGALPPLASSTAKTTMAPLIIPSVLLPLSINAPERKYPSALPGINVTHPHGALQGGGTAYTKRSLRADVADILDVDSLRKRSELVRRVQGDINKSRSDLVRSAKARKELIDHNNRIREQLKLLDKEREEEIAFEQRWRKEREEKVRERKKRQGQAEAAQAAARNKRG
jgi:hypothetical protein